MYIVHSGPSIWFCSQFVLTGAQFDEALQLLAFKFLPIAFLLAPSTLNRWGTWQGQSSDTNDYQSMPNKNNTTWYAIIPLLPALLYQSMAEFVCHQVWLQHRKMPFSPSLSQRAMTFSRSFLQATTTQSPIIARPCSGQFTVVDLTYLCACFFSDVVVNLSAWK